MRINHSAAGLLSLACLALAACQGVPTGLDAATGSAPSSPAAQPASPAAASAIITLTNQTRASNGLSPLSENAALDHAATILCNEVAQTGLWSHVQTGTAYPNPQDRAAAVGYVWRSLGENLAATTTGDAQHVFSDWMNSTDHRANILGTSYTEIGVAQQQIGASVCSVQVFGSR